MIQFFYFLSIWFFLKFRYSLYGYSHGFKNIVFLNNFLKGGLKIVQNLNSTHWHVYINMNPSRKFYFISDLPIGTYLLCNWNLLAWKKYRIYLIIYIHLRDISSMALHFSFLFIAKIKKLCIKKLCLLKYLRKSCKISFSIIL